MARDEEFTLSSADGEASLKWRRWILGDLQSIKLGRQSIGSRVDMGSRCLLTSPLHVPEKHPVVRSQTTPLFRNAYPCGGVEFSAAEEAPGVASILANPWKMSDFGKMRVEVAGLVPKNHRNRRIVEESFR